MTYPIQRASLTIALAVLIVFLLTCGRGVAVAGDDLFTEDFTDSSANWANYDSSGFLTHVASGGPDGGAYASGPRSFEGLMPDDFSPVIFRARHDNPWNSSGDAFVGNWNTEGIRQVRAFVRHHAPTPLTFFLRVAVPFNFPGHAYTTGVPVAPDTWVEQVFDVSRTSADLLSPEDSTWGEVYNNVGHLQFGVLLPTGLEDESTFFTFDIDKVTIATPEPSALLLAVGGMLALVGWARGGRARTRRARL